MLYELQGPADKVQQVIRHFGLTIWHEYSQTLIEVNVSPDTASDLEEFCDRLGVDCHESD